MFIPSPDVMTSTFKKVCIAEAHFRNRRAYSLSLKTHFVSSELLKLPVSISSGFCGEKGTAVHPEEKLDVCREEILVTELTAVLLTIQNDLSLECALSTCCICELLC